MVVPSRQRNGRWSRPGASAVEKFFVYLFQSKCALAGLNLIAIVFLISSNQSGINDYYDLGVSSLNTGGGSIRSLTVETTSPENEKPCPDATPLTAASMSSTTSIVELNDPMLHKTATVMAMATGYNLIDYQRFVGSLRKTGYEGNIILVVAPSIGQEEESYLNEKNVIMHKAQYTNCSHPVKPELAKDIDNLESHEREMVTCVHPYPKLKHRWARFPLLGDLLKDCGGHPNPEVRCGGPVLITDMRDTLFQRNPFGPEAPKVHGLQVFEEHYTIRTTHWVVDWPVGDCKNVHYDEPMLCSGTTIGTRQAMLDYLEIFHREMNVWMESPKCCCFETNADDQSMHNYLYYSGMLQGVSGGVTAVKNRNGLVNTVGGMGSLVFNTHKIQKQILLEAQNDPNPNNSHNLPFDKSAEDPKERDNWLGLHYGMTDRDGYFVDFDGSRSFVIHQYDRFANQFVNWLEGHREEIYM